MKFCIQNTNAQGVPLQTPGMRPYYSQSCCVQIDPNINSISINAGIGIITCTIGLILCSCKYLISVCSL